MELLTILAADYANIAEGGKLNVMGIFRNINGTIFPTRIPSMHLVIKLGAELGEYGQTRELTIKLFDPDGKEVVVITGPIEVPNAKNAQRPEVNAVLELRDIVFQTPGRYQFCVIVDKDHKGALSLDVFQVSNPADQKPV